MVYRLFFWLSLNGMVGVNSQLLYWFNIIWFQMSYQLDSVRAHLPFSSQWWRAENLASLCKHLYSVNFSRPESRNRGISDIVAFLVAPDVPFSREVRFPASTVLYTDHDQYVADTILWIRSALSYKDSDKDGQSYADAVLSFERACARLRSILSGASFAWTRERFERDFGLVFR